MNSTFALTAVMVAFLLSSCAVSSTETSQAGQPVVAEVDAPMGAFPWMAHVFVPADWNQQRSTAAIDRSWCGGTLIDAHQGIILTAAHCVGLDILRCNGEVCPRERWETGGEWMVVALPPHLFQVAIGFDKFSTLTEADMHDVVEVLVHPDYDDETSENDLALLRVTGVDPTTPTPDLLGDRERDSLLVHPGRRGVVARWGITEAGSWARSDALERVSVPLVSHAICAEELGDDPLYAFTDTMLCAGMVQGGRDSGHGSSGGPLTVHDPRDLGRGPIVAGIVSWGDGRAEAASAGVYTSVIHFREWIATCSSRTQSCARLPAWPAGRTGASPRRPAGDTL